MTRLIAWTFVCITACGSKEATPAVSAPADHSPRAASAEPTSRSAAPPSVEKPVKTLDGAAPSGDDRYALKIEPPLDATSGQEAQVAVRVVPKAPWHINLEFPTSLKLEAPDGVKLAKAELKKADAAKFDESTAHFDVAFTPDAAGEKAFSGKFKFAVCQDEACSPVVEEVAFKVAVK